MPTFSNETDKTPGQVTVYETTQIQKQNSMKAVAKKFLIKLQENKKFLPRNWVSTTYNWVESKRMHPPVYVTGIKRGSYRNRIGWHRHCWRIFGFRVLCGRSHPTYGPTIYTWNVSLNNNFENEINTDINNINNWSAEMDTLIFNDCSNKNTLLDTKGLQKCDYQNTVNESYQLAEDKLQISRNTLGLIKNTDDYPQYEVTNKMNEKLIKDANWKFTDKINSQYPDYNYQYDNLKNLISERKTFLNNSYDNCDVPQTSLTSVDSSGIPIPPCVTTNYNTAYNECGKAYEMAQTYQYGSDKLFNLWTDVSNSVPGNSISANRTILNNASGSCKKWVEMFNMWQKDEEAALAAPCIPERPIASPSDKNLLDIIDAHEKEQGKRLDAAEKRIKDIMAKMVNYPNILLLKKENILGAPYGMTPSVVIKNEKTEFGNMPIQYLEMILPNGEQGDIGESGEKGIKGLTGKPGPIGKTGPVGNPILPF